HVGSRMTARPIPNAVPHLAGNEWRYLKECLDTNWVSSVGPFVERFERETAAGVGAAHAVAAVTGTAALHVALLTAGVRPGDEVLVPALTFIATANAVCYCGATPVFVEVGYNYRLTNLQAALGVAQLEQLSAFVEDKRRTAAAYARGVAGLDGVEMFVEQPWARSTYWMPSVLLDPARFGPARDVVRAA